MAAGACLIRKEPVEGFLTTHEAICRALAALEDDEGVGEVLVGPLRLMTQHQARFDPAVAARCQWAAAAAAGAEALEGKEGTEVP